MSGYTEALAVESGAGRDEFVSIGPAARVLGVAEPTLRRLVREAEINTYADPCDKRRKLVRVADLERFKSVVIMSETGKEETHVA